MITKTGTSFLDIKRNSSAAEFPNLFTDYVGGMGDVYFWDKGHFHVVTKASLAREVLTSENYSADRGGFFISRMPDMDLSLIGDFFGIVKRMMVMSDDKDHAKKRQIASAGFEDHILERFTATVQNTVKRLVAEAKSKNHIEFAEDISKKLPSTVLADLFNIPETHRENFFDWAGTMTGFFGGASAYQNADGIAVNHAAKSIRTYFETLLIERRQNPGQDYVSILLRAQQHTGMDDQDLIAQLIMMLVAGQVTTTDQINNCMYLLATNTEIQTKLKESPELVGNALEELKRLDPAVTFIFRVARADCLLGEQPIKKGDVIFVSTHCVNRDLPLNEEPHHINIKRKASHFAYGHGPHYCLGAKLGRLEIRLLFEEILKELPILKLDPTKPAVRDHYSLSFSGFKELPLTV